MSEGACVAGLAVGVVMPAAAAAHTQATHSSAQAQGLYAHKLSASKAARDPGEVEGGPSSLRRRGRRGGGRL